MWTEPETQGLRKNHFQGLQHLRWTGKPYPQGRAERISQVAFTWGPATASPTPPQMTMLEGRLWGASSSWNPYPSFHSFLCTPPGGACTRLRPLCLPKVPKESLFFSKTSQDSLGAAVYTLRERPLHSSKAGAHNSILGPVAEPGGSGLHSPEGCTGSSFHPKFYCISTYQAFLRVLLQRKGEEPVWQSAPLCPGQMALVLLD